MPPSPPHPSGGEGPEARSESHRLLALTLALEDSLAREAWDEADGLFAARDLALAEIPAHAVPREIDDIDARILARLQRGQAGVRQELTVLTTSRQAVVAYAGTPYRSSLEAA